MNLVAGQKCSQAKAIIFILTVIMLHVTKQQLVMILSIRCHGVNYKSWEPISQFVYKGFLWNN